MLSVRNIDLLCFGEFMTPLEIIEPLRDSDPYIKTIFTQGSCYKFHIFLKSIFTDAEPVTNNEGDHIASIIDGVAYDINGVIDWVYRPLTEAELHEAKHWSFSENQWLSIGDCPYCFEPIPV